MSRDPELHILQHSLGLDDYGQGTWFRNHFVTGEGSIDHPICMSLVAKGLMSRRANIEVFGGMDGFNVTEAGKQFVRDNSPKPPKLSRAKQRYNRFLKLDGMMTFREFLASEYAK